MTNNLIVTNHNCNVIVFIFFNKGLYIPVIPKYSFKTIVSAARPNGHASRTDDDDDDDDDDDGDDDDDMMLMMMPRRASKWTRNTGERMD